MNIRNKTIES